ncbi:ankyrin repeat domain-containing protein 17-like [Haliotis rubra]|uniref:ankyrin repeat domain-containing protein 17-like n=1 Tax=Haliotis rubra TaxID=36100 RepID=UPI001EE56280|nr:ankyrin repeat domain-containing protein 17-like [Haliotis rubra]
MCSTFLLQEGADVLLKDRKGNSCLHHACISGKRDIVKVVVEKVPGMIDNSNFRGLTSTMLCAETGQEEILKFLVSYGADLSVKTFGGQTCLHVACASGHLSTVQYLLSCETIDISERTILNTTPIMMAAEKGHSDVYHLLVLRGADVFLTDDEGKDCLMYACQRGNMSIVRHLLSLKPININERDHNNMTPVTIAAKAGHSDVYHLLVSDGADVSLTDDVGSDCLMYACEGGNMSIVRHLLSLKPININERDHDNMTPAMIAVEAGHSDVYHLLVSV